MTDANRTNAFRSALAARNEQAAKRLMAAYENAVRTIKVAAGRWRTTAEISAQIDSIQRGIQRAIDGLNAAIVREATAMQRDGAAVGRELAINALDATIRGQFGRPSLESILAAIGYVDSAAWRQSIEGLGAYYAQGAADLLLAGIAGGKNPLTIARDLNKMLDIEPLKAILRSVRTVQLWSARRGQQEIFKANRDVVRGWWWSSALDKRTCVSCWSMHGTRHGVDEILNDHHMGRCAMVPITVSWGAFGEKVSMAAGEDVFRGLPEADQREIMGAARWLAWRDRAFRFDQLSAIYSDAVYGPMRHEASLVSLIGDTATQQYIRTARAAGEK